jgi:hypothetical protein
MMKSGFSDWNQPVGVRKLPTSRRAYFSAKRFEPARLLESRPEDHHERKKIHEDHAQAVRSILVSGCGCRRTS